MPTQIPPGAGQPAPSSRALSPALRELYLSEAAEQLDLLEAGCLTLEAADTPARAQEPLALLFRCVHTLKGNSAAAGYADVAALAHDAESLLEALRDGRVAADREVVSLLLETTDALRALVHATAADSRSGRSPALEQSLPRLTRRLGQAASRGDAGLPDGHGHAAAPLAGGGVTAAQNPERSARTTTLRVPLDKLNRLLTITGEVTIARGRARDEIAQLHASVRARLDEIDGPVDQLMRALQELVLELRMVPLRPLLERQERVVRDLAERQGKLVRLVIDAGDVELDTAITDQLRDPLTHMVRNAVDHGLEHAATRLASGKPPEGTLTLRARRDGDSIVVEVIDDGAGISPERVLRRAVEKGIVAPATRLSEADALRLIFQPGFSTAERLTEVSGRGVGLDVVRRNVETLRGTIDVTTPPGGGSCFTIRLPLTIAILNGFSVGVGDQDYVIPLDAVVECVDFATCRPAPAPAPGTDPRSAAGLEQATQATVLHLRGAALPSVRLRELFALPPATTRRESVVVVAHGGRRAGLIVDRLHGEGQAVVRPLGRAFETLPGISGSTIRGDGRVALILDVPGVLARAGARADAPPSLPHLPASVVHDSPPFHAAADAGPETPRP